MDADGKAPKTARILVSSGPTREHIDDVRFLSNRSTGKMGHAVAEAAAGAGCEVLLVSGPVSIPPPENVETVRVESAAEMAREIRAKADWADAIVMAAAVADYRPKHPVHGKIKKDDDTLVLELERTEDILESLGELKGGSKRPVLAGFAAETAENQEDLENKALDKLRRKNLDLLVANDISKPGQGFASDDNAATIIRASGEKLRVPLTSKKELAKTIVEIILEILETDGNRG